MNFGSKKALFGVIFFSSHGAIRFFSRHASDMAAYAHQLTWIRHGGIRMAIPRIYSRTGSTLELLTKLKLERKKERKKTTPSSKTKMLWFQILPLETVHKSCDVDDDAALCLLSLQAGLPFGFWWPRLLLSIRMAKITTSIWCREKLSKWSWVCLAC